MKKILVSLFCAIAILGLNSCLDDNDDSKVPTVEEVNAAMKTMSGTYSGYLCYGPGLYVKPDTIWNMTWTVDSVITIKNFPQSIFAGSFTIAVDSTLLSSVRALPAHDLKCAVGFYSIDNDSYSMDVLPYTLNFPAVSNGKSYDCSVVFLNGDWNSKGIYKPSTKGMEFLMNTYGFYMNKSLASATLFQRSYFKLVSTSKQ